MQPTSTNLAMLRICLHKGLTKQVLSLLLTTSSLCVYSFGRVGDTPDVWGGCSALGRSFLSTASFPCYTARLQNNKPPNFPSQFSGSTTSKSKLALRVIFCPCWLFPSSYKRSLVVKMTSIEVSKIEAFAQALRTKLSREASVVTAASDKYQESIARWSVAAEMQAVSAKAASFAAISDVFKAIIVFPDIAEDVSEVVNFAVKNHIELAVCGGGHATSGSSSSEGGICIDLSRFNEVAVRPKESIVYAGGGALCRSWGRSHFLFQIVPTASPETISSRINLDQANANSPVT